MLSQSTNTINTSDTGRILRCEDLIIRFALKRLDLDFLYSHFFEDFVSHYLFVLACNDLLKNSFD